MRFSVQTMMALLVLDVLLHKVEISPPKTKGKHASVFFKPRET